MPAYKDSITGKWYVQFWHTDYAGKKKKKMKRGFPRKSDALKWEAEYKLKMSGSPDMTFASLTDHYLEDCRTRMKIMTMERKQSMSNTHLLPAFGDMALNEIDARTVRAWQNRLLKQKLKPSYTKALHSELSATFNYGIRYYNLPENPAKKAGPVGNANSKIVNFWTLDEFNRFIEQVADEEAKTIFTLLFWSGMRIGEALALTLNDFNRENKTVTISKTKARLHKRDIITSPKTEKSKRTITLPDNVLEQVDRYVFTLYDYNPTKQLFMLGRMTISKRLNDAAHASKLKQIRIHDLRHSHASLLIEMGFPPLMISERLGHENMTTTMNVYSHLYPNKQQDIADKLNNLKNGIKTESAEEK